MCGRHQVPPDVAPASSFTPVPVKSGAPSDQQAVQAATTEADALKALRNQKSAPPIPNS
ncbi:MAG: hypothetical protein ABJE95_02775 [Byssovorax sp.]